MNNQKEFWEAVFQTPEEASRRRRVRGRKTYSFWRKLWTQLKCLDEEKESVMRLVMEILDRKYAWGSEQKAEWARESLILILEDLKEV